MINAYFKGTLHYFIVTHTILAPPLFGLTFQHVIREVTKLKTEFLSRQALRYFSHCLIFDCLRFVCVLEVLEDASIYRMGGRVFFRV